MPGQNGPRGPYRKGIERRQEIIAAATQLFAESGYQHSSMRELAKRVQLSQPAVLHYFAEKEELLVEVLGVRDRSVAAHLSTLAESDIAARSREVARHAVQNEGLTSLFLVLAAEAIFKDHPAHGYFSDHYRTAQDETRETEDGLSVDAFDDVSIEMVATLGIAVMDGLQLQQRYRDDLDIVAAVDAFWRLVAAARRAWSPPGDTAPEGDQEASA